jgi:hypothetical protein
MKPHLVCRVIPNLKYFTDCSLPIACALKAHDGVAELCPFLCPPRLEFDVFWYERLIGKKRELMAGFIGPSASVRLRLKSSRRDC